MEKIGIIGAMPVEIELLKSRMEIASEKTVAGRVFFEGVLCEKNVVLTTCGIGKVNSASCVQILCSEFGVTNIVNTGIAGALAPSVDVCDIVVSKGLMYHDFNMGFVRMGIENLRVFEANSDMIEKALKAGELATRDGKKIRVHLGNIATGDQFVAERAVKNDIYERSQALCVEMEGGAIAHVSALNGVPFVIVRSISDNADDCAELSYEEFEPIAANLCANFVCDMLAFM